MKKLYSIEINRPDHIQVNKFTPLETPVGYFYRDESTKAKFKKSFTLKEIELDEDPRELYTQEQAIGVILKHNVTVRKERNAILAKASEEFNNKYCV